MTDTVRIECYQPRYREDFIRLNRQWIETYFRLEVSDLKTFAHVDDIVAGGGQIFLAINEADEVVGCCALINHPERSYHELAKMAVSPKAQGQHIGLQLGQALIAYAREHGVRRIFLEGNTRLAPSIHLYRKLGFRELPLKQCDTKADIFTNGL